MSPLKKDLLSLKIEKRFLFSKIILVHHSCSARTLFEKEKQILITVKMSFFKIKKSAMEGWERG